MNISELVGRVLHLDVETDRSKVTGPETKVSPQAALSLSLLLHELATTRPNTARSPSRVEPFPTTGRLIVQYSF